MTDEAQVPPPPSDAPPPPPSDAPPPPPSEPPAAAGGSGASENRQLWIVLSYLWLLALIPYLVEQEDEEVQWHAKHGLVLTGAEIILWIALTIVNWLLGMILGPLACIGCLPVAVLGIAILVFHVLCIVKGLDGQRMTIPGVSEYADRF